MDGATLGAWNLTHFLGEGSTGRVFEASDGRRAGAVKILRPSRPLQVRALADGWDRLQDRLRSLRDVDDRNVIDLWDWGRVPDEALAWIAMERLHGAPLSSHVRHPPDRVRAIGLQAARGLRAAHERSVVHGDLKPHNLFREHDGRIVLLDFALRLVPDQTPVGSPLWMAPECLEGASASAAADIYALGQTLGELLTGRPAFTVEGSGMGRLLDLLARKRTGARVDPGEDAGPLRGIVQECTAPDPHSRPTASELVAALSG